MASTLLEVGESSVLLAHVAGEWSGPAIAACYHCGRGVYGHGKAQSLCMVTTQRHHYAAQPTFASLYERRTGRRYTPHEWPSRLRHPGVYFVQQGGFVKVGRARGVEDRRRALEFGMPHGAVIPLGWIHIPLLTEHGIGRAEHEQLIHRAFAQYRERGEWFQAHPRIEAFILKWAEPWPVTYPR
jgi:hypothetical protein